MYIYIYIMICVYIYIYIDRHQYIDGEEGRRLARHP